MCRRRCTLDAESITGSATGVRGGILTCRREVGCTERDTDVGQTSTLVAIGGYERPSTRRPVKENQKLLTIEEVSEKRPVV